MIEFKKLPGQRILELGCGDNPHPMSDVRVDTRQTAHTHFSADFNEPLPIKDEDFDGVYSAFTIEHLSWRKVRNFVKEIYRVLRPGGTAVLVTANTKAQWEWILSHPNGWGGKPYFESASCIIFGDQDYPENTHKNFMCPNVANTLFKEVGFANIEIHPYGDAGTDMVIVAKKLTTQTTTAADILRHVKTIHLDNKSTNTIKAKVIEQSWYTTESIGPILDSAKSIVDEFYQGAEHWSRMFEYPWALSIISKLPPGKLLDSGGSEGCFQLLATRAGHKVFNVDLDELGHKTAKARYKNYPEFSQIELVAGDLTNLQYPDNFFDNVVSISTLEHISDYKKAITELWRTLKPGGKCILTIDVVKNKSYNFHIDYIALYEIRDLLGMSSIVALPPHTVVCRDFIDRCTKTGDTQRIDITVWCACLEKSVQEEPIINAFSSALEPVNSKQATNNVTQIWLTKQAYSEAMQKAKQAIKEGKASSQHWSRVFEYPWARDILEKLPKGKLLDAGGGDGPLAVIASKMGFTVTNADTDTNSYTRINKIYSDNEVSVKLDNQDLTKLDYPDGYFDVVVSISVIEHIDNYLQAVKELYRVLKPGGYLIMTMDVASYSRFNHVIDLERLKEITNLFGFTPIPDNDAVSYRFKEEELEKATYQDYVDVKVFCFSLKKELVSKNTIDFSRPQELFDKDYFGGGGKVGGYAREGYRDFPVHEITFNHVLARKPESVIELGAARGYILKRLHDVGISGVGYEVSKHCVLTRATHNVIQKNLFDRTWEHNADLCFSVATLEHVPEEHIPNLIKLMSVHCKRGLHGIDFGEKDDGYDKTHVTLKNKGWWLSQFDKYAPGWPVEIVDKEELEKGNIPQEVLQGDGKVKLNLGSFMVMFHHGWINIDIHDFAQFAQFNGYKYQKHDLKNGIPYGTSEVDLIYTSHTLQCLSYDDGLKLLRECRRVLKPGGCIRIIVPDADILMEYYKNSNLSYFNEISHTCEKSKTELKKLHSLLYDNHLSTYDFDTLGEQLKEANFVPELRSFRQGNKQILKETIDMFPDISLFVEGTIEV